MSASLMSGLTEQDWKKLADAARAEADQTPEGPLKDELLRKARQLDTASRLGEWLKSPGLMAPKE